MHKVNHFRHTLPIPSGKNAQNPDGDIDRELLIKKLPAFLVRMEDSL